MTEHNIFFLNSDYKSDNLMTCSIEVNHYGNFWMKTETPITKVLSDRSLDTQYVHAIFHPGLVDELC